MSVASVYPLQRTNVVGMLQEMGFLTAENWSDDKLLTNLRKMPQLLTEETDMKEPSTPEYRDLLAHICKAVNEGTDLEFAQTHHNNGEAPPSSTGKKKAPASKPKKETTMSTVAEAPKKKAKKEKADKEAAPKTVALKTDKFGSREGTKHYAINACISKKAKSMSEIAKEAGFEGKTYYNHLNSLVEKGKVEKTEDGKYKLV